MFRLDLFRGLFSRSVRLELVYLEYTAFSSILRGFLKHKSRELFVVIPRPFGVCVLFWREAIQLRGSIYFYWDFYLTKCFAVEYEY